MAKHSRSVSRRTLVQTAVALACAAAAGPLARAAAAAPFVHRGRFPQPSGGSYSTRAIDLVERSLVIDMLSPVALSDGLTTQWFSNPATVPESWFAELERSGIDVLHEARGTGPLGAKPEVLTTIAAVNGLIAHHGKRLLRVTGVADLDEAQAGDRIGILFGVQNADHFETLDDVNLFYGLGQRVGQLTYNARNRIGTGSTDRADGGLSDFGASIVERMNQVGMAVDVSHCGDRTSLDAFEVSKRPVLVTHSNVRALAGGHVRCKSDDVLRAVGASGSVIGITGVRMFVKADEPTTIEHVLDHFDYVARLIGTEHLGIGSDIDLHGYDAMPKAEAEQLRAGYQDGKYKFRERIDIEGLAHPQRVYDLTEGLIRRGYSDADITGVLGGNWRRVLQQVWLG